MHVFAPNLQHVATKPAQKRYGKLSSHLSLFLGFTLPFTVSTSVPGVRVSSHLFSYGWCGLRCTNSSFCQTYRGFLALQTPYIFLPRFSSMRSSVHIPHLIMGGTSIKMHTSVRTCTCVLGRPLLNQPHNGISPSIVAVFDFLVQHVDASTPENHLQAY